MTARLAAFTPRGSHQIAANCNAAALSVLIRWSTGNSARGTSTHTFLVERVGILDLVERVQLALDKYCGAIAVFADVPGVMTHNNEGPVPAAFEQLAMALGVETAVTDGNYFIDQEAVKLDCHGNGEGEPCAHACGVTLNRLAQIVAKL